ncbi:tetratricopeptide repeat protein [candidate division KSB1 bacterium]|nr:tetratricopeptide repeat protein [candidate division KSB1 bacterium]
MYEATGSRYPGSRPFHDDAVDRIIFRGREKEKARLLQLILAEKLVVLYAKSGMGKTSLLNAGVFQALRLKGYFPFALRLNDPEKAPSELIYEEIAGAAQMHGLEFESGHKGTLWQYFKTTEFWSKKDVLFTPVLVFDQFEEIFTLGFSETQKKEFFIQLADLVRGTMPKSLKGQPQIPSESFYSDKPPNIKIVISIREDFLGDLEELADDIPTILRNRFRLTPLTQEQAKRAIEEPAGLKNKQLQTRRFSYTKRAVNTMIKFLSEGRKGKEIVPTDEIELFQLQVLCQHIEKKVITKKLATTKKILKKQRKRSKIFKLLFQYTQKKVLLLEQKTANKNLQMRLWRNIEKWFAHKMKKPGSKIQIAPDDFGGLSGMQKIWRNFYDTQIKQFTFLKRRAVRILCETGLISSTGRRLSLEAEMIKEKFRVTTDILSRLIANRLLRVEPRLNGFYYELSHDNLVSPIKRSAKNRRVKTLVQVLVGTGLAITVLTVYMKASEASALERERQGAMTSVREYFNSKKPNYDKAVETFRNAVDKNSEVVFIYDSLKVALDYSIEASNPDGLKSKAKYAAKEIAKIAAETYKKDRKWAEATSAYQEAITFYPYDRDTYRQLVAAYKNAVHQNQEVASMYDDRLKVALDRSIKVSPDSLKADAMNAAREIAKIAAEAYEGLGRWQEAKLAYEKTIKFNRRDQSANVGLANAYWKLAIASVKKQDYDKAGEVYKEYINIEAEYDFNYDKLLEELKKQDQSWPDTLYKIASAAYTHLGDTLKARHKLNKAIRQYKKAVALDSMNYRAYASLARAHRDQKNYAQASTAFAQAIKFAGSDSVKLYNSLGLTYVFQGESQKAKEHYLTAIGLDSTYTTPLYNLSRVFFAEGDFKQALQRAEESVKKAPNNTAYQRNLEQIKSAMKLSAKK